MALVIVLALAGLGAYLLGGSLTGQSAADAVAPVSAEIRIPISDVSSGKARFFDYQAAENRTVRFFVIKSSDDVYRAALDTCDVCYRYKQGYMQDGDDMVCRKCGQRFASAKVNDVSGGCNPIGVQRAVEGDYLIIKTSELEAGRVYF